jgi:outer membrane protein assembly factor BamB
MNKPLCTALMTAFITVAAHAAFQPGDVLVTGSTVTGPFAFVGHIVQFDATGGSRQDLRSDADKSYGKIVLAPNGNAYVTTGFAIDEFAPDGSLVREFGASVLGPVGLTRNAAGMLYAGTHQQSAILQIDPSTGAVVQTFPITDPGGIDALDLAADQCTVVYARPFEIGRFNVCTGSPLPALASLTATDLRFLPDGSVLVATGQGGTLLHLSPGGATLRDYGIPAQVIALDPSGTSVWIHNVNGLQKVDLVSGAIVTGPVVTNIGRDGLTVVGEPRAALVAAVDVPTLSPRMMALLLVLLIGAALLATR